MTLTPTCAAAREMLPDDLRKELDIFTAGLQEQTYEDLFQILVGLGGADEKHHPSNAHLEQPSELREAKRAHFDAYCQVTETGSRADLMSFQEAGFTVAAVAPLPDTCEEIISLIIARKVVELLERPA